MNSLFSFIAVVVLVLVALVGVKAANLQVLFGVVIPYAALAAFVAGFIYRVVKWGKSPVPFRIPTTCGQQKSLPWIKQSKIENPSSALGVVARMALEVLVFRSLFRNMKTEIRNGRVVYGSEKWLWAAGLAFHWSFLIILVRHLRFFMQSVPLPVRVLEALDSFLQIGAPLLYMTDAVILLALTYLVLRRFFLPQIKHISLAADYFPLFLLLGVVISGVLMRYFFKVHVVGVKVLAMGLVSLRPEIPEGVGTIFYVHLFLLSVLFAYFPWSKLMHLGGVFMSPTRNLANNSREVRHVNPWNRPVKVHTYEEYEEEFRDKMKSVGLPVEKE
ncbi:MAG: sulfate reduction electron transfer complex DsrMKJOP subunit DsrM [Thermodesulfovibrionales bacterium]